jgi:DNA polymerase III psi subunit
MIDQTLLSKIYTDDIYLVNENGPDEDAKREIVAQTEKAAPPKPSKTWEIVVLTDIEPNPSQKELLSKILQAVGLTIEKIKLIIGTEFPENIKSKYLISFNVVSPEISIAEKYKVIESATGKILLADSLAVLDIDIPRKKALWQALQKMYNH